MATKSLGVDRPRNSVYSVPFSPGSLKQEISRLSKAQGSGATNHQTEYLARYLSSLEAATLVIEEYYIDRHYIEEVALYYSRCLLPKPNCCARIHIFAQVDGRELDDDKLSEYIRNSVGDNRQKRRVGAILQAAYLGYIVVRPLPSVPIGRTVLRLRDHDHWVNRSQTTYSVHFLGFELTVDGLAFQQQDQAVGACATVAIWTALQRQSRRDGARAPTPSEITEAAVRHFLPAGRPFPSPGLTIEQICEALRSFDFPPVVFDIEGCLGSGIDDYPDLFKFRMGVYLRSGMPVILALRGRGVGHAVTAVGYSPAPGSSEALGVYPHSIRLENADFDSLYVSDDRLGPNVPAKVVKLDDYKLALRFAWPDGAVEEMTIDLAVVPLYPKVRTSAYDLFETATELLPLINVLAAEQPVGVEMFFARSGTYLASLYRKPVKPSRLERFQRRVALSRYVGVMRWKAGGELLADTIWDTTDRGRHTREVEQLLGIIGFREEKDTFVQAVAEAAEVAFC